MLKKARKYWWILLIFLTLAGFGWMVVLSQNGYVWADWKDLRNKSIWMILELLIVPITLAIFIFILDKFERQEERNLNLDNQRERLLQNYFDSMSDLILKENLKRSNEHDEVREIAQIKTLTTLKRLDIDRKSSIMKFLCETELIQSKDKEKHPIIFLREVNLEGINLKGTNLEGANLVGANLEEANLERANLTRAILVGANLKRANLWGAFLDWANLEGANLTGAMLRGVDMEGIYLKNAVMPDGKYYDSRIHTIEYLSGGIIIPFY